MTDIHTPHILLSSVHDTAARPAALTRSHGEAMERALLAIGSQAISGLDVVELGVGPQAFAALRKPLKLSEDTVAVYDLFAVRNGIDSAACQGAGQLLSAEGLWTIESTGILAGVPLKLNFNLEKGWPTDAEALRNKVRSTEALELSPEAKQAFEKIKKAWDKAPDEPLPF